jgi:hypothetical protein
MSKRILNAAKADDQFHEALTAEIARQLHVAEKKSREDWQKTDIKAWAETIADNVLTIFLDHG